MNEVLQLLTKVGAVLPDDHFVGTSGKHMAIYINKDALYPHMAEVQEMGEHFANALVEHQVDAVVGPALGGIILAQWTAHSLCEQMDREILGMYAEKKDGTLKMTRGYDELVKGKRVAVVEDLTTTGGSLKTVIEAVQEVGGEVVVAAVMVNKNPTAVTSDFFGVPFVSLAEMPVETYDADDCILCKNGIPVNTSVGHGKKFVESQKS